MIWFKLVHENDFKAAFGYVEFVDRNASHDEEFCTHGTAGHLAIGTNPTYEGLEPFWRQIVAEFFMNFPDDALQEGFASLSMTPKQPNLAGVENVRNVVAQLQEQATGWIKDDCGCNFSDFRKTRRQDASPRLQRKWSHVIWCPCGRGCVGPRGTGKPLPACGG